MDFSTEFVALRDRLRDGFDSAFASTENFQLGGRVCALYSSFGLSAERKVLGIMPTGNESHAHEYRLLFAAPGLTAAQLDEWWDYALHAAELLVHPDAGHEFSIVSLILAADQAERDVQKKLKKLACERRYEKPENGWSSIRMAVIDLSAHRVHTNRMGTTLKNVLSPFL